MGDEFKTRDGPVAADHRHRHQAHGEDRHPRDSEVVQTLRKPKGASSRAPGPIRSRPAGTHYYYVRVLQADDEIAWASPMWIEFAK